MRKGCTEQIPDDVLFYKHHAERTAEIGEQRRKSVVQIRVDDHLHWQCRHERDGLDGRLGAGDIAAFVEQVERVVLRQVAERRGACLERHDGVLHRCRRADHVIPEMRSHRHLGRQPSQAIGIVDHQSGTARAFRAQRGRVSHAPVEDEAVAVDTVATPAQMSVDFETRPLGLLDIPVADLGLEHDLAGGHAAAFVFELAVHSVFLEECA